MTQEGLTTTLKYYGSKNFQSYPPSSRNEKSLEILIERTDQSIIYVFDC